MPTGGASNILMWCLRHQLKIKNMTNVFDLRAEIFSPTCSEVILTHYCMCIPSRNGSAKCKTYRKAPAIARTSISFQSVYFYYRLIGFNVFRFIKCHHWSITCFPEIHPQTVWERVTSKWFSPPARTFSSVAKIKARRKFNLTDKNRPRQKKNATKVAV